MLKKMHHIGIIVEDFDSVVKKYEAFGMKCSQIIEKEAGDMRLALLPIGDTIVEFVSYRPDKKWDHLNTVVRSQNGAINHLCFEVDNMEETIHDFEKNRAKLIEGTPMAGATGRIAFFYPETTEGVLIELCEV